MPISNAYSHQPVVADLAAVLLWSALGLAVTALLTMFGFGAEMGQLLALAG